jgi:predicted metal-binding membrane protein
MTDFSHLRPLEARLGHAFGRPKLILGIVMLAVLGWAFITLSAAHLVHGLMPSAPPWGAADFGAAALMWCAMALAMMLPSAGPMILTYAEFADTAARKGERIVSPWLLASGYGSVWLGFALTAAVLQGALTHAGLLDSAAASTSAGLSASLFLGAGLYQFSTLKHVCLTRCQRPFPFFLANWTTRRLGIYRLGLWQGLYCLGCCWVLMLSMFALGIMNMAGMAVLGLIIVGEKMTTRLRRPLGVLLIVVGTGLAFFTLGPSV